MSYLVCVNSYTHARANAHGQKTDHRASDTVDGKDQLEMGEIALLPQRKEEELRPTDPTAHDPRGETTENGDMVSANVGSENKPACGDDNDIHPEDGNKERSDSVGITDLSFTQQLRTREFAIFSAFCIVHFFKVYSNKQCVSSQISSFIHQPPAFIPLHPPNVKPHSQLSHTFALKLPPSRSRKMNLFFGTAHMLFEALGDAKHVRAYACA